MTTAQWNKLLTKLGMTHKELSLALGLHRTAVQQAMKRGLISNKMLIHIHALASQRGVEISLSDFA